MDVEYDRSIPEEYPGKSLRQGTRKKTSQRIKYEAETAVFRSKYGGLEGIRQKLGFSQRKMGQMLMVDPSAWSRWVRNEEKTPPHIFRALEWLLLLEEKNPELVRVLKTEVYRSANMTGPMLKRIEQLEAELDGLKSGKAAAFSKFMLFILFLFAATLLAILLTR
jgi:transcriptional regulator with XRE-family HTH domain